MCFLLYFLFCVVVVVVVSTVKVCNFFFTIHFKVCVFCLEFSQFFSVFFYVVIVIVINVHTRKARRYSHFH